jgi:hypothetical protein
LSLAGAAVYCKFCGNFLFRWEEKTYSNEKNRGLILKGHVPAPVPVPVEIGGEASLGNRKISTGAYKTKVCTECLNEHVVDNYLTYDPMRASPNVDDVSESTRVAIIPYMLYLDLKDCGYSEEKIQSIPSTTYADLLRIKKTWEKRGNYSL